MSGAEKAQTAESLAYAQAQLTAIALEYGTVPLPDVIDALRADQWLDNHPEAEPALQTEGG